MCCIFLTCGWFIFFRVFSAVWGQPLQAAPGAFLLWMAKRTLYDYIDASGHVLFASPHLLPLTIVGTVIGTLQGWLHVHLGHVLFTIFVMARVPFVGFCMSACLHRYFAHAAFKTSRPFQVVLALMGNFTFQGGALWWASKHLRHHKHCDLPDDPHSAKQTSEYYAWLGWIYYEAFIDW